MKNLLIILCLSLMTLSLSAQRRGFDPEERAKRETEQMVKNLDLNKITAKKVGEINKKYTEKNMKMFQEMRGGGDREAMRENIKKLMEEKNEKFKKILTEDQYKKHLKALEERRKKMEERRKSGGRRR